MFKYLIQKIKRTVRSAFFVDLEHPVARTVVYCRVFGTNSRGYFTRVHPYPLAWNRAAVAYVFRLLPGWFGLARGVQSFRLKILCMTDTDREIEWCRSSSLRSRLGPGILGLLVQLHPDKPFLFFLVHPLVISIPIETIYTNPTWVGSLNNIYLFGQRP